MSLAKEKALELIRQMPDTATTEEILEELSSSPQGMHGKRHLTRGRVLQKRMSRRELFRNQKLRDYLSGLRETRDISVETAQFGWRLWKSLKSAVYNALPVPNAAPGPNGELLLIWNKNEHHFEAEIFPDLTVEFFYRNRTTDQLWEWEYAIGEPISAEAIELLSVFSDVHER